MSKVCLKCETPGDIKFYGNICKDCKYAANRLRYQNNKEKEAKYKKIYRETNKKQISSYQKEYYKKNKERISNRVKKYRSENRNKIRDYELQRDNNLYREDLEFRLKKVLRSRIKTALNKNSKSGSAVRDLGCSIAELKKHLESQFQPGMSWDNYGHSGWHIDHIKPLAAFDLTDENQLKQACHYTNLQPLWAIDNLKKSNTYEENSDDGTE